MPKVTAVSKSPYAAALQRYAARDTVRLNVPGHNAQSDAAPELAAFFGKTLLALDVPPLLDTLDKGDENPMAESLELAAAAWHAKRTWFLTNGASQGNRIAALTLSQLGGADQPVLAQRSAHSSFIDGIILGGLIPVFMTPVIDSAHGINHGLDTATFAATLAVNPGAKGVYMITPSYFGAVADVATFAELAHEAGMPLVVDAAWGSHFGFHPDVPANPLDLGADLMVSSTHKLGGSLTQSAMLHLGHGPFAEILEPLIERAFMLTQSTSASSILLASLDIARAALVDGQDRLEAAIRSADALRAAIRNEPGLDVVSDHFADFAGIVDHDPLHVSVDVRGLGVDGHYVREELMRVDGIFTEISTDSCIVAIIGPGHTPDIDGIIAALRRIGREHRQELSSGDVSDVAALGLPATGTAVMRPRDAYFAASEVVSAVDAIGRVSADTLSAYPPGIPNLLPGELITRETVDFLQRVAGMRGGYVRGAADAEVKTLRVVSEPAA